MSSDPRFDQAEADVDYGKSWRFRDEGMPNPLTIEVTGWSLDAKMPNGDLVDFVRGVDRDGEAWSILVGGMVLKQHLIEGRVEEWDEEKQGFVTAATLGRVQPGDVVSLKYTGEKRAASGNDYPTFRISRIAGNGTASVPDSVPVPVEQAEATASAAPAADSAGDDIPF
jgi:hypothetical protein